VSAPVDVLAVMDSLLLGYDNDSVSRARIQARDELRAARAVVAELIKGAKRAQHILALHDDRCPQLDAALANVGSVV